MTEGCKHEWLAVSGGDVSVTRARELGHNVPEFIKEEGLKYAICIPGYKFCMLCGLRLPRGLYQPVSSGP